MTWKGEQKPATGEPGDAIEVERNRMSRGSKRGKRLASRDLKEGQIGSNDEMLGRANRAFQLRGFDFILRALKATESFYSGLISYRRNLEMNLWSSLTPTRLLDNDLGHICSCTLVNNPAQSSNGPPSLRNPPSLPWGFPDYYKERSPQGNSVTFRRPKTSSTNAQEKARHKFYAPRGKCIRLKFLEKYM